MHQPGRHRTAFGTLTPAPEARQAEQCELIRRGAYGSANGPGRNADRQGCTQTQDWSVAIDRFYRARMTFTWATSPHAARSLALSTAGWAALPSPGRTLACCVAAENLEGTACLHSLHVEAALRLTAAPSTDRGQVEGCSLEQQYKDASASQSVLELNYSTRTRPTVACCKTE